MIEKGRLLSLVEFVQQSARLRAKPSSAVNQHGQFAIYEHQFRQLPGVRLDSGDSESGDEIWLTVDRLHERKPPEIESPILRPWIQLSPSPVEEPRLLQTTDGRSLIATGTHRSSREAVRTKEDAGKPAIDPDATILLSEYATATEVEAQLESYLKIKWRPWAAEEDLRRKTIRLYAQLFTLKQQLEGGIVEAQLELAWGVGIGIWKCEGVTITYPLITRLVEITLNTASARIEVRTRDIDARLELDWYASVNNPGVPELEKAAKEFFRTTARTFSPFDRGTFEPLLRSAASYLDANGIYWPNEARPEDRTLPRIEDNLRVTDTWVLFSRPRTQSVFLQDLERLKGAIEGVDELGNIPGAVAAVVTDPSDSNPIVELPSFRGVCASYQSQNSSGGRAKKVRDLYFPKAFNSEQVRIIQLLEVADGVVVQGPPGTGKTHTIANVICHYLAEGKRVLVTSMKDPALAVLQAQLPDEIQSLAISLLSSEQEGMKQFEHAIQKIASEVQALDRSATARAIGQLEESIDSIHGRLAALDRRVSEWAEKNLTRFSLDSQEIVPLDAAHEVAEGAGQFEWLPDALGAEANFAPQMDDTDVIALRAARRALGSDIGYLNASIPQLVEFPDLSSLLQVHRDLSQFQKLIADIESGDVPALAESASETFDQVHELVRKLSVLVKLIGQIERADLDWAPQLQALLSENRNDLFSLLDSLGAELIEALETRKAFVEKPVSLPPGIERDNDIASAIGNLSEGRSAFGFAGIFGKSSQKATLETIRVVGQIPTGPEHWVHVHNYVILLKELRTLGVRWNALASELGLPSVDSERREGGLVAATHYQFYLKLKEQVSLTREVVSTAIVLFPSWRWSDTVHIDNSAWAELHRVLQHHISGQRLSNVWFAKDRFQKALDGRSGKIVDDLRVFIADRLGNPETSDSEIQADWSVLMSELSRVLGLRSHLDVIQIITQRFEASGALNYAAALRAPVDGAVDALLPDNWRKAWRLRRLATYLESIDPRDELKRLASARREAEGYLARAYSDVVVLRTWLKLAENAAPSIRAALQSYLAAIQKIGKGTGKRAVRFRQDARVAASHANSAVPCWIMPHYRVSESLPAELGCFDLVIIDEASQSDLSALPSLLRAKKVLVVGDDKQVSPEGVGLEEEKVRSLMTRFLADQVETYRPQMDPSRSIYDLFKVVFATNSVMLKEHFRCVPAIIEYSKREFYNHELRPLRLPKNSERLDPPLIDVLVEDGYRKGDSNLAEAKFIVEEIKKIVADPNLTTRSIGVVSLLADKQALAIWERLTDEVGPEFMQRHNVACGDARTFQGKERDIMFLSMVSAPNDVGAPLSRDTFAQRFNVAASRARDRMYLVRSVSPEHLSQADRLRRSLIAHFTSPFAQDEARVEDLRKLCESPFEREVYDLLVDRGYRVTPQVKVGQYRIDMVVEGDNDARLAVECDGDKYHGADKWADDMQRQGDLERAGWSFWRCFASTFLRRRQDVIADLLKALSEHGIEPLGIENGPRSVHTETRIVSPMRVEISESETEAAEDENGSSPFVVVIGENAEQPFKAAVVPSVAAESASNRDRKRDEQLPLLSTPTNSNVDIDLLTYCRSHNLKVIDNRTKNGALWVEHHMRSGTTAQALKTMGMRFAEGKGWWIK